jgi:hypothetical protein
VTLLDSFLDPHPENPAIINGVRVPVMKSTVTFLFNSIRQKHRIPLWQLDSAFLHKELKKFVSLGHIKIVCALGLIYPPLVHS